MNNNPFRYIFGCGEATQRLFHESKVKFGKINNLFMTEISWDMIGGLPGFLLTSRDAGKKALSVHGPSTLSDFFKSTQSFLSMQNLDLNCVQYSGEENEKFEDENIIVWPICVQGIYIYCHLIVLSTFKLLSIVDQLGLRKL